MGNANTSFEGDVKSSATSQNELYHTIKSSQMNLSDDNLMKEGRSGPLKSGTQSTYASHDDATVNTCTTRGTLSTFETAKSFSKRFIATGNESTYTNTEDDMNGSAPCYDTQALTDEQRRLILEHKFKHQQHYTKDLLRSSTSSCNGQVDTVDSISETPKASDFGITRESYTDHEVTHTVESLNPESIAISCHVDDRSDDSVESSELQDNQDGSTMEDDVKPFFTLLQMPDSSSTDMWKKAWDQDDDDNDEDDDESDEQLEDLKVARRLDEELQLGVNGIEWERVSPILTPPNVPDKRVTRSCINANAVIDSHSAAKYEKPCLEAFEQLRVLGKGSFGKVSSVHHNFVS